VHSIGISNIFVRGLGTGRNARFAEHF